MQPSSGHSHHGCPPLRRYRQPRPCPPDAPPCQPLQPLSTLPPCTLSSYSPTSTPYSGSIHFPSIDC